jgi:hypothetical protein
MLSHLSTIEPESAAAAGSHYCAFNDRMPRMSIETRTHVVLLTEAGFTLRDIQQSLKEEGINILILAAAARFPSIHLSTV